MQSAFKFHLCAATRLSGKISPIQPVWSPHVGSVGQGFIPDPLRAFCGAAKALSPAIQTGKNELRNRIRDRQVAVGTLMQFAFKFRLRVSARLSGDSSPIRSVEGSSRRTFVVFRSGRPALYRRHNPPQENREIKYATKSRSNLNPIRAQILNER